MAVFAQAGQGRFDPAAGRDNLLVKGQTAPDKSGQTAGGAAMTDVSLDAGNGAMSRSCAEKTIQCRCLHGILARLPAGVGFQVTDRVGRHGCVGIGPFKSLMIGGLTGEQQAAAGVADALYYRIDSVAVSQGIVQPFQDNGRGPFADGAAVGLLVKGNPLAGTGKRAASVVTEHCPQISGKFHCANKCAPYLATLKEPDSCFQGANAGTILVGEGEAWPADAEFPGDAAGNDTAEGAHGPVGRERWPGGIAQLKDPGRQFLWRQVQVQFPVPGCGLFGQGPAKTEVGAVKVKGDADEDTGLQISFPVQAGICHGPCGDLQHEQLLGEHLRHLQWRDAELLGHNLELVKVKSVEGDFVKTFSTEPGAFPCPPPVAGSCCFSGGVTTQNPLLVSLQ